MKKILLIITICLFGKIALADTTTINRKLADIERTVKQIDANQLNYRIEKDLLKETYSNNYENINLVITLVLGVIGVLGYMGLKDISSIKKEYEKELSQLREIQSQFNVKALELDTDKKKLDEELKSIIKENQEQSRKIKFIELKDKTNTLLKDDNLATALEFANAALQIQNDDVDLLNQKGRILCRLNQLKDASEAFNAALAANPNDSSTIFNTAECLHFANDLPGAKALIEKHRSLFENRENGKLLELFYLIELFFAGKKDDLLHVAKNYVTVSNREETIKRIDTWDLSEAKFFAAHQDDGELKTIFQSIIWYWDGQLSGKNLLSKLNIESK